MLLTFLNSFSMLFNWNSSKSKTEESGLADSGDACVQQEFK